MTDPLGTRTRSTLDRAASLSWRFLLVVAAVVVLGAILARLELVVVPLAAALLIAIVVSPGAALAERVGLGRTLGVVLIYVLVLGGIVGLAVLFTPRFLAQFASLGASASTGLDRLRDWLVNGPLSLSPSRVDALRSGIEAQLTGGSGSLTAGLLSGATTLAKVLAGALLTLFLSFFFVKDGAAIWSWLVRMLPAERRASADAVGRRAWSVLGRYLLGSAINGAVESGLIGLTLLILRVPLVAPLMLLQFAGAFFPLVGAIVAGGIAVAVALASGGLTKALIVLGVVVLIHQLEGNVLAPLVIGGAVRLHPVVVLIALTAGAVFGGVVGAFLAVPVTAVTWGVIKELIARDVVEPPGDRDLLTGGMESDDGARDDVPGEEGAAREDRRDGGPVDRDDRAGRAA